MAKPVTDLDIASWGELAGLPDDLDALTAQMQTIATYARTWVCQARGFEPSDLCLLRPLARLMDLLAEGFTQLEAVAVDDLGAIRSGVVETTADLGSVDTTVAERFPVIA